MEKIKDIFEFIKWALKKVDHLTLAGMVSFIEIPLILFLPPPYDIWLIWTNVVVICALWIYLIFIYPIKFLWAKYKLEKSK